MRVSFSHGPPKEVGGCQVRGGVDVCLSQTQEGGGRTGRCVACEGPIFLLPVCPGPCLAFNRLGEGQGWVRCGWGSWMGAHPWP